MIIVGYSRAAVAASDTHAELVVSLGAVHFWRFNESTGNFADSVGSLTAAANPNVVDYTYQAAGSTGDGDYSVTVGATARPLTSGMGSVPQGTNAWSLEAIVKTTSTAKRMIVSYGAQSTRRSVFFVVNGSANPRLGVHAYADDQELTATGLLDGNWHHVVAAHGASSATVDIYMDGSSLGTLTYGGNLDVGSSNVAIMHNYIDQTAKWTGGFDELAVYPSKLSATNVSDLFDAISVA